MTNRAFRLPNPGIVVSPRVPIGLSRQSNADLDELSLAELWRVLKRRQRSILMCTLLCTLLALAASLYMTPKYEGVATIEVQKSNSDMVGLSPADRIVGGESSDSLEETVTLATEANALQSASLAFEVVQQLGLENRREFALHPGRFDDKDQINAEFKMPLEQAPLRRQQIYKTFNKNLRIKPIAGTRLIEVHFLSPDPQVAGNVPNLLVKDLLEQNFRTRHAATAQVSDWLSGQLSDLKAQVEGSQEKLNQIQKVAGIMGADEKNNVTMAKLEELNKQLTAAEANRILKQTVYQLARSGSAELISGMAGSSLIEGSGGAMNSNPLSLIQSLRAQEAELKAQVAEAASKYGSAYPKLAQMRNQLNDLDASIEAEVQKLGARAENDYRAASSAENMLRASFNRQKEAANQLNSKAVQYTIAKREVESGRKLYEDMLTKLKEAGILGGLRSTNITVVDPARTTARPVRPSYPMNLGLGFGFGLLCGIVLAFARDGLDDTIRTPEQVEEICALPPVGMVPDALTCVNRGGGLLKRNKATCWNMLEHPTSPLAEACRALRTHILLSRADAPPKVIMITSGLPCEGKSTISVNTAIALAQQGSKVLLIDADLRHPTLERMLKMAPSNGLSEFLASREKCEPGFIAHPELSNLLILPAGAKPPDPAELIGSMRMGELLTYARKLFDFIVIDTPPVLSVSDAIVMSRHADSVLLVVRSGETARQSLLRARDVLMRANANLEGVLVNGVDMNSHDYRNYYGYSGSKDERRYYEAQN